MVVTQPDRPGHRLKLTPPAVKVAAGELGLPVFQPERIREPSAVERLRAAAPELIVVVAYGQIIPRSILELPPNGVLNVHASLLPRWRGAAPVAHAILAGDEFTGVTIMQMDEQLDHGPVLAKLLVETIAQLESLDPREQDHAQATLAPKLSREAGELEWGLPADEIDRRVRAFQPWPGVTLPWQGERVKVLRGRVEGDRYVPEVVQAPGGRPRVVDGR
ncbi:MAG: hypothetical protein E6I08_11135 [Chloroflexi bacterium]|nr:MAG: hypothetical protein E6I08_11135 [Chloroflexota bacterium]